MYLISRVCSECAKLSTSACRKCGKVKCSLSPFNPTTTIGFGIQNKANVKITVLNSIGEEVTVILNEEKEGGYHQVEFNAAALPSGVYFYQLRAGDFIQTKKMILLR